MCVCGSLLPSDAEEIYVAPNQAISRKHLNKLNTGTEGSIVIYNPKETNVSVWMTHSRDFLKRY